jgi:hypothetical protein
MTKFIAKCDLPMNLVSQHYLRENLNKIMSHFKSHWTKYFDFDNPTEIFVSEEGITYQCLVSFADKPTNHGGPRPRMICLQFFVSFIQMVNSWFSGPWCIGHQSGYSCYFERALHSFEGMSVARFATLFLSHWSCRIGICGCCICSCGGSWYCWLLWIVELLS